MLGKLAASLFGRAQPPRFALADLYQVTREQLQDWLTNPERSERITNTRSLHTTVATDGHKKAIAKIDTRYDHTSFFFRATDPQGRIRLALGEHIAPENSQPLSQNALELQLQVSGPELVVEECKLGGRNFRPDVKQLKRMFQVADQFRIARLQGKAFHPVKELLFYFEDHRGLLTMAGAKQQHLLNPPPLLAGATPGANRSPA